MEKLDTELKKILESKSSSRIFYIIVIFIGATCIFSLGVSVGTHKASFNRAWGEHYYENFGMHMNVLDADDLPSTHGAIGKIIRIALPNITVADTKDNIEKIISLSDDTHLQKGARLLSSTDLLIDDYIIVIGEPSDTGTIDAKFVRVLPNPESIK